MDSFPRNGAEARELNRRRRQKAMDACPVELRPYLQALEDARDIVVERIKVKVGVDHEIEQLTKIVNAEDSPERQASLASLKQESVAAHRAFDEAKAVVLDSEKEFIDRQMDYRVRQVPAGRREEARALLLEQQAAIRTASQSISIPSYAGSAGLFFGLSIRLDRARQERDQSEVDRLTPMYERAETDFQGVQESMKTVQTRRAEIAKEYDLRIEKLGRVEPKKEK